MSSYPLPPLPDETSSWATYSGLYASDGAGHQPPSDDSIMQEAAPPFAPLYPALTTPMAAPPVNPWVTRDVTNKDSESRMVEDEDGNTGPDVGSMAATASADNSGSSTEAENHNAQRGPDRPAKKTRSDSTPGKSNLASVGIYRSSKSLFLNRQLQNELSTTKEVHKKTINRYRVELENAKQEESDKVRAAFQEQFVSMREQMREEMERDRKKADMERKAYEVSLTYAKPVFTDVTVIGMADLRQRIFRENTGEGEYRTSPGRWSTSHPPT